MFIRSKTTSKLSIFILATLFFSFTSILSAKDSLTDSLPPFNPEPTSSTEDSLKSPSVPSSDKNLDTKKTTDIKTKVDPKDTTPPSTLDSIDEKASTTEGKLQKEIDKDKAKDKDKDKKSKKESESTKEAKATEQTPAPAPTPFKADPVSTLMSFQLDLVGLATFISVDSNSLVRTISSGFSVFYKLRPLTSSSTLLLNLGYRAFTTYTKDKDVDFDLTTHYYFAGSSYKQKIVNGFSISGGINLGISALKKFYIDSGKQTKIAFTPGVMANFQYDFEYIENLSAGLKVEYNFGKLSFLQHSLYVGLNF